MTKKPKFEGPSAPLPELPACAPEPPPAHRGPAHPIQKGGEFSWPEPKLPPVAPASTVPVFRRGPGHGITMGPPVSPNAFLREDEYE